MISSEGPQLISLQSISECLIGSRNMQTSLMKIIQAYGMFNKVHSLFCEKNINPHLKTVQSQFPPFLAKLQRRCTLYKTILAKNHPKGRNKEKCNQLKYKGFPPCTHMKHDMQHKGQLQLVQSTVNELYSDEVLRHMHIFC